MDYIIRCPKCGWEYLPGEIFVPNELVGQPYDIERTSDGKIISAQGKTMCNEESYECDHCGKVFNVTADIKFVSSIDVFRDFDEDYKVDLYPNRITLEE